MAGEGDSGSVTIETFKAFNSFDLFKTSSQSQVRNPSNRGEASRTSEAIEQFGRGAHCSKPPNVSKEWQDDSRVRRGMTKGGPYHG
jgi:hypothetical protein